jgi:hypothetical protein
MHYGLKVLQFYNKMFTNYIDEYDHANRPPPDPNKLESLGKKISPSVTQSFGNIQAGLKKKRAARALEIGNFIKELNLISDLLN